MRQGDEALDLDAQEEHARAGATLPGEGGHPAGDVGDELLFAAGCEF